MDYRRHSNGWLTFLEHWWFAFMAIAAIAASQGLSFFSRLSGAPWIWCYGLALIVAGIGVSLIFYAKLPLYRWVFNCIFGESGDGRKMEAEK